MNQFNGIKVFSATKARDRDLLGELVTDWIRSHQHCEIVDKVITQSSDEAFHCLAITLFYNEDFTTKREEGKDASQQKQTAAPITSRVGVGAASQRVVSTRET